MSQICYDEISLQEVVRSAQAVVVVRPADPISTTEEIPVPVPPPDPHDPDVFIPDEPIPPFTKVTLHYIVEEVLLNETAEACVPGQTLDVQRANWRDELRAHVNYYGRGLSESPICREYVGGHDGQEIPFIAFLTLERDGWRFATDGAVERMAAKQAVLQTIQSRAPALQAFPEPELEASPEPNPPRRPGFWARLFGRKR